MYTCVHILLNRAECVSTVHTWTCGAHMQVQDLPSNGTGQMYVSDGEGGSSGATRPLNIGELDEGLGRHNFFRQYCESNEGPPEIREFNCLWTKQGRDPLWVSGRPQNSANAVQYNVSKLRPNGLIL